MKIRCPMRRQDLRRNCTVHLGEMAAESGGVCRPFYATL